jgi:hypothetical protein
MPASNTFASVEGFVTRFDVEDDTLAVGAIHISVDNLTFLKERDIIHQEVVDNLAFLKERDVIH